MSKKLIGVFVFGYMFRSALFASEIVNSNINFNSEITKLSSMCSQENCDKPYSKLVSYHYLEQKKIDENLKKILERISYKQAQIWADTILEGDYAADGNTRLDKVINLYKNNELIGYLITYSEKAWNTSDCNYDGINDASLAGCVSGRIIESSYVSLDFKEYFYDDKTAAVFL